MPIVKEGRIGDYRCMTMRPTVQGDCCPHYFTEGSAVSSLRIFFFFAGGLGASVVFAGAFFAGALASAFVSVLLAPAAPFVFAGAFAGSFTEALNSACACNTGVDGAVFALFAASSATAFTIHSKFAGPTECTSA